MTNHAQKQTHREAGFASASSLRASDLQAPWHVDVELVVRQLVICIQLMTEETPPPGR